MKLTKSELDKVRDIKGFPIAKDDDIIELSRPPYYTACPNPFVEDFIRENGTEYDEASDNYHREPFAADVSEGKHDPIYMAHSYHTKVPYKAIMRYILHYTEPGDIVLDGFCGTGMTGVAAQMCGNPDATFKMQLEHEMKDDHIKWGARKAILNDLSPAASFISYNYNAPVDVLKFSEEAKRILRLSRKDCGWMYETQHVNAFGNPEIGLGNKPIMGKINYTVWSDIVVCPSCSKELTYWDVAVDEDKGVVSDPFICPHCKGKFKKNDCERAFETIYDEAIQDTVRRVKSVPVMISYSVGRTRYKKRPDEYDIEIINKIDKMPFESFIPTDMLPHGFNTDQPMKSHEILRVHQFYTKRNALVLSNYWNSAKICEDKRISMYLRFLLTSVFSRSHKLNRYMPNHFRHVGPLSGTLYVPALQAEISILDLLEDKLARIVQAQSQNGKCLVTCESTSDMKNVPDNSIDYIFTDPPFGDNLNYSELNYLMEAWIGVKTNNNQEAVINPVQKKGLSDYQSIMYSCFKEYYRVLKPGRWITVEFHNSKNTVWNAITEALGMAGFIVANVDTIDKKKGTTKQLTYASAVKQDLVISAYKPKASFVRKFQENAGSVDMVWEFVRQHLSNVPVAPDSNHDGRIDMVAERQDYLLFDRMVAWHIMNGIPVPMDAHTFYEGLREHFIEREKMFFLSDQVNEYDEKRSRMDLDTQQLAFVVNDEKNAIGWLNYILGQGAKTYSEIQPMFLQELHQSKQEKMPDLLDILKENFVQDEKGAWYVPDLHNASDLAKIRRKALLKEFNDSCVPGKAKLKVFRMEAIRAGFDECWKNRDYRTIVSVGQKLPESALQEDSALLMYYDNASSRLQ